MGHAAPRSNAPAPTHPPRKDWKHDGHAKLPQREPLPEAEPDSLQHSSMCLCDECHPQRAIDRAWALMFLQALGLVFCTISVFWPVPLFVTMIAAMLTVMPSIARKIDSGYDTLVDVEVVQPAPAPVHVSPTKYEQSLIDSHGWAYARDEISQAEFEKRVDLILRASPNT
jgi:hypothetical protein